MTKNGTAKDQKGTDRSQDAELGEMAKATRAASAHTVHTPPLE